MHMGKSLLRGASLFLFLVSGSGCTTTATINAGTTGDCAANSSVVCEQGTGYSCSGDRTPDQTDATLACSSGEPFAGGSLLAFCCSATGFPTSSTCSADSSVVGCQAGSYGFSCTGQTRPESVDSTLVCSDGVASGSATDFCCITGYSSTNCVADSTVQGCQGTTYGFHCTGSTSPSATDPSLTCSAGTPGVANDFLYCCETPQGTTTSSCGADPNVTGCTTGSTGYTCTGAATPDASLNCSTGVPGIGSTTVYCCGGTAGTCAPDSTVAGCATGSAGYTCTGSVRPDASGSLQCSTGVSEPSGGTGYCCYTTSTTTAPTCTVDSTVTGCTGGSYGFACTSTNQPSDENTNLVCGPGAAGNDGNTLYCCTGQ